jgi:hypothetical protein
MHLRALILATATLLALSAAASADEVNVAGRSVSLVPPEGACAYDRNNEFDAAVMKRVEDAQEGLNKVVLQFGRCEEFPRWRMGGIPFSQFGQIMLPLSYPGAPQPLPLWRREYLNLMASQIPQLNDADIQRIEVELNGKVEDAQIKGSQLLGILDRDENALYVDFLGVLEIDGKSFPQTGIGAVTMLGSIPVSVNLYSPVGEGAFDKLIDAQKVYVAELIRRNP